MDAKLIKATCDSTARFVDGVSAELFDLPTPCSEWNVRQLLNHLLGMLRLGAALMSDQAPPGPDEDLTTGDVADTYRSGAEALLAATTPEALARAHSTPFGQMPGSLLAGFAALDVLVHGWDLAKATGQHADQDPSLAEPILDFAQQTISDEMGTRAPRIGPLVPVAPDADATARLVAFLGRTP